MCMTSKYEKEQKKIVKPVSKFNFNIIEGLLGTRMAQAETQTKREESYQYDQWICAQNHQSPL